MDMTTPEANKKSTATFSKEPLDSGLDKDLDGSDLGDHICEVCGTSFETRRGLSSHARFHLRQLGVGASDSSGAPIDLLYQLMKERGGTLPKPQNQPSAVQKSQAKNPRLKKHTGPKLKIKISNLVKKKYALSSSSTIAVKKSTKPGRFPFAAMKPHKGSSKETAASKAQFNHKTVESQLSDDSPSTSRSLTSAKPLWAPQETDAPLNLTTMINSTARDDVHVCELCGAWYETRKGLSSHARAHLRQFGVNLDSKGAPIEALHKIIQTKEFQEKASAGQLEEASVLEDPISSSFTPSTSISIIKNPTVSPKGLVSIRLTPPPTKKQKIFTNESESSKYVNCEFCHEKFKKSQSLASHARSHLRQLGITEWTVHGSPMATLRRVMAQRGVSAGSLNPPEPSTLSPPASPSGLPTQHLPSPSKIITQSISPPLPHKVPKARKGSRTVVPKPKEEPVEIDISAVESPKPQSTPTSPLSPQKMSSPTTAKTPLKSPKPEEPSQIVSCNYCGEMFDTRKALSCHARAHLRQLGIKWSEKVSPINTLYELMQREGTDRVLDVKPESATVVAGQWNKQATSPHMITSSPVDSSKDKSIADYSTTGCDATCELCGFDFENRKALASHARAHLRQLGVDWKVIGSPIETLAAWMKSEPKKVSELHKRYSRGDLPFVKKGPRKPPSANYSSESVRRLGPSQPFKATVGPARARDLKAGMSHSPSLHRKRPSSGEAPLSSLIQTPTARSELNVRSPRGCERRPPKHLSHLEEEPSKPSRTGNIPSLVPRPPETSLVKLVGKVYSLKCRFCEEVFQGPLSIQEDWVMHLQQHILKLKKDSTSSPQTSQSRDPIQPSLPHTDAPLLIGPQAV